MYPDTHEVAEQPRRDPVKRLRGSLAGQYADRILRSSALTYPEYLACAAELAHLVEQEECDGSDAAIEQLVNDVTERVQLDRVQVAIREGRKQAFVKYGAPRWRPLVGIDLQAAERWLLAFPVGRAALAMLGEELTAAGFEPHDIGWAKATCKLYNIAQCLPLDDPDALRQELRAVVQRQVAKRVVEEKRKGPGDQPGLLFGRRPCRATVEHHLRRRTPMLSIGDAEHERSRYYA